jgi:excisionase family DNA binding protein
MAAWLDIREAATRSGFSTRTIYRAIKAGELKAAKVRSRWRIAVRDLEEWLRPHTAVAQPVALCVPAKPEAGSRQALKLIESRMR